MGGRRRGHEPSAPGNSCIPAPRGILLREKTHSKKEKTTAFSGAMATKKPILAACPRLWTPGENSSAGCLFRVISCVVKSRCFPFLFITEKLILAVFFLKSKDFDENFFLRKLCRGGYAPFIHWRESLAFPGPGVGENNDKSGKRLIMAPPIQSQLIHGVSAQRRLRRPSSLSPAAET